MNPLKTIMMPFTKKRKLMIFMVPKLFGRQIQVERVFKYVGIRLDDIVTWNIHFVHTVSRAQRTLMMVMQVVGSMWALNLQMMQGRKANYGMG